MLWGSRFGLVSSAFGPSGTRRDPRPPLNIGSHICAKGPSWAPWDLPHIPHTCLTPYWALWDPLCISGSVPNKLSPCQFLLASGFRNSGVLLALFRMTWANKLHAIVIWLALECLRSILRVSREVVLRLLYTNPFVERQELCDSLWEAAQRSKAMIDATQFDSLSLLLMAASHRFIPQLPSAVVPRGYKLE